MALVRITALLRKAIGLDTASVGLGLIERAVKQRISANGLGGIAQYVNLVHRSESELQRLIEAVVIPETFFFRYPESFSSFRQIVGAHFLFGSRRIRVLSVPCSTGEEPFSIAMSLLDLGFSAERFHIDAIDVSSPLLNIAKAGQFGRNSFRGTEWKFRDEYFQKTPGGFQLGDRVRKCVHFEKGNLLDERFRFGGEPYDFIFCRNLLIYFEPMAHAQALKSLSRLLAVDGLLFVGPAETRLLTEHHFVSMKLPMAFAFHKSGPPSYSTPRQKQPRATSTVALGKVRRIETNRPPVLANPKEPAIKALKHKWVPDLTHAEELADKGLLKEAAEICEASLREFGPSARAFHLLGLISDGAGDQAQAGEFYRRALYLEPEHYDALRHLALLKDQNGDRAAAQTLQSRARRVLEGRK